MTECCELLINTTIENITVWYGQIVKTQGQVHVYICIYLCHIVQKAEERWMR